MLPAGMVVSMSGSFRQGEAILSCRALRAVVKEMDCVDAAREQPRADVQQPMAVARVLLDAHEEERAT